MYAAGRLDPSAMVGVMGGVYFTVQKSAGYTPIISTEAR